MTNPIAYITQLNINGSANYNLWVDGTVGFSGGIKVGAYTLPATDGTSGQVLCTNGSGTVSWGVGGGGGATWADGSDPYICPCNSCSVCAPILYATTCIQSGGCISGSCLGIGASSSCPLYISGNGTISGVLCGGTCVYSPVACSCCIYGSRILKIPVGTNCY